MQSRHILALFLSFCLTASPLMAYQLSQPDPNIKVSDNVRLLRQISAGVSELSDQTGKAVVLISISKILKGRPYYEMDPFDFFFGPRFRQPDQGGQQRPGMPEKKQQAGVGSGFFVDLDKGYIITNNHVVDEADEISLKLGNGATHEGKVIGRDRNTDIAVVQIKDLNFDRKGLTALSLGNSDNLKTGEFVIALGAPFGLEFSQSFGAISAVGRGNLQITDRGNFIQTDAAINPGNSGGPLINMEGLVIGVNTAIYSRTGSSAGIGFAVPSNLVRTIADQLITKGKVASGYMGVQLAPQELDEELIGALNLPKGTVGALIANVEKDTPAGRAGLESGDVITQVDGSAIRTNSDLTNAVYVLAPGTKVRVTYLRNGKQAQATVVLGDLEKAMKLAGRGGSNADEDESNEAKADALNGLSLEPLDARKHAQYIQQLGIRSKSGLLVLDVDSSIASSGIREGDVLLTAGPNKAPLRSLEDFKKAVKGTAGAKVLIQLERGGTFFFAWIRK